MKLNFVEDIDIDVSNWQQSILTVSYGLNWSKFLPSDIKIENIKNTDYLKGYLENKYYKTGKITDYKKWMELNVNTGQIQEDLKILTGKIIKTDEITAYITTFHRAPYSVEDNLLYTIYRNIDRERSITNIYHELMHFIFHVYYWDECKRIGLSKEQTNDLKECITVILNPILEKRGLPLDQGYPRHQELRKKLIDLWVTKEWEFRDFLREVFKISEG